MSVNFTLFARAARRLRGRQGNVGDVLFAAVTWAFAATVLALLLLLLVELVRNASLPMRQFGWAFLWTRTWDPVTRTFGALPFIYGTVMSSCIALLLAVPIGLGTAIFLAEFAPGWLRSPLSFLVELLAAIPSVVYGLWGVFVLVPLIRDPVQVTLKRVLGFVPLFQGPTFGISLLAGGVILAIMVLPTVIAITRDVVLAVPSSQREAMYALGATKWEVIRGAVLPYGRSGIIGGVILALGRALGETMAVTMVIGNRPQISLSWFQPAATLASVIANEFTEATYDLYLQSLVALGLILIGVAIIVNLAARLLIWRLTRGFRPAGSG
ncbi:MAG: phosphate ABC transporter permease subunit PstC [Chloroflexota bacterium]